MYRVFADFFVTVVTHSLNVKWIQYYWINSILEMSNQLFFSNIDIQPCAWILIFWSIFFSLFNINGSTSSGFSSPFFTFFLNSVRSLFFLLNSLLFFSSFLYFFWFSFILVSNPFRCFLVADLVSIGELLLFDTLNKFFCRLFNKLFWLFNWNHLK